MPPSSPAPALGSLLARGQLALAMLLAGSSVVLTKIISGTLPPFLANVFVLLPAALVLLALCRWREGGVRVPPGAWPPLLVQALCGVVLFRVFLFYGLPLTSAASAGILTSTVPAVTALLAWGVLRERPGARGVVGVLLTALGVLVLTVPGASAGVGPHPLLGNLLVLGAVAGEAAWNVLSKLTAARVSPLTATTWVTLLALGMFVPLALPEVPAFDPSHLRPADGLAILAYALGATVLAYLLWFAGVRRVSAGTAAVSTGWLPVSAVALSALVLGEPLTVWHALGLGCVLCATFVLARS